MPETTMTKVTMAMMFYVAQSVIKNVIAEPIDADVQQRINTIIFNRITAKANEALVNA